MSNSSIYIETRQKVYPDKPANREEIRKEYLMNFYHEIIAEINLEEQLKWHIRNYYGFIY